MEEYDVVDPVPVPEQVRGILCALASGWVPDPMRFGQVAQLWYNELDLSEFEPDLSLHSDKLQVTLTGARLGPPVPTTMDGKLEGAFAGGGRISGEMILRVRSGANLSQQEGARSFVTIEPGFRVHYAPREASQGLRLYERP